MNIIIDSPIGHLQLVINNNILTSLLFTNKKITPDNEQITNEIIQQLHNYFVDPKQLFTIKVAPNGTPFQQKVWHALTKINSGKNITYGELGKQLNTSAQAIGNACRNNPIPIIIPCHRVVAKKSIGGYAGKTKGKCLKIKKWLLQHEART